MSGSIFVDTNVLLYARDLTERKKQRRAAEWMTFLWDSRRGRLSMQVLQEYYSAATTRLKPARAVDDVREDVIALQAWKPSRADMNTMEKAWAMQDRYGFSWWDSLIVASAVATGSRYLLTEDLRDEQIVEGITFINPFTHGPDDVA